MQSTEAKRTPMYAAHLAAGARMVAFAGWQMPVQYRGVIEEHTAVRTRVGLFDVSHMGEVRVRGRQALDCLQHLTCNDVARLRPGRAQYTALTTVDGCFVDDILVYRLDETDYLAVINAANATKDVDWIRQHAGAFDAEVVDESDRWCQLAVQGPAAAATVAELSAAPLEPIRYYGFVRTELAGERVILSRTGYTGEDGFEIYADWSAGDRLWRAVLDAGAVHGILPVGLAARDTLRLEAKMALYGNEIDDTTTVYEADLGWIVKLDKGEFIGRRALVDQRASGLRRKLVGFELGGRAIARNGFTVLAGDEPVGRVTSGTFAPHLRKSIGLAYVPIERTEIGSELSIDVRGRRETAKVVATPFYKRQ
ncbi:MAG TPA: glycine cleavage system aminomethyltransferase GcvT [Candidatus Polarisedimenticolaceae bacterium]|nr:glycine cleavage system aminomethyltransferase GcvT [Candidatus Polarisedimenticolaceae bacterium]